MNSSNRKSIRLPDYDYSAAGDYYITICIQNRECLLGSVLNEKMELNQYGLSVRQFWEDLPNYYSGLKLGAWVVMPNHFHGILILSDVGAIQESPGNELSENKPFKNNETDSIWAIHESPLRDKRRKMLLSKIIGRFKMTTGKHINLLRHTPGTTVWQRNYFEHIIRNQESYDNIEHYIINNPLNWNTDKEYTR